MNYKYKQENLINAKTNYIKFTLSGIAYIIAGTLLVSYLIFAWVYASTPVLGTSMMPTLNPKGSNKSDIVYINRFHKGNSEDIIVVDQGPEYDDSRFIVKRIVAKENDKVSFKKDIESGEYYLYVNGVKKIENYLFDYKSSGDPSNLGNERTYLNIESLKLSRPELFDINNDLVVPKNMVFALGDNRGVSIDSSMKGPFSKSSIVGKVDFIVPYGTSELKFILNRFTPFCFN